MDSRAAADRLMRELVKLMGTQAAVAKALKQSRQAFNYWFNHASKVPYDQLLAMRTLLEKVKAKNNDLNVCSNIIAVKTALNRLYCHPRLLSAEQQCQLPLRTALVGLLAQSDADGYFAWQPQQLKKEILPYIAVDFMQVLEELQKQGWIQKQRIAAAVYGRVILN